MQRLVRGSEADDYAIPSLLRALRTGALRVRATISDESWRSIDRLCSDPRWQAPTTSRPTAALARLIDDSVQALSAFAGILEIGRRVERGMQISQLAEHLAGCEREVEEAYLRDWLTLSDSTAAYRARYMMTAQTAAVIDLLVLDETNPRSLAFQVARLERVLGELPTEIPYRRPEHRLALGILTELRLKDAGHLARADGQNRRADLAR